MSKTIRFTGTPEQNVANFNALADALTGKAPEPTGTFACPICGQDTPHFHSAAEVSEHATRQKLEDLYDLCQKWIDKQRITSEVAGAYIDNEAPEPFQFISQVARLVGYAQPVEEEPSNTQRVTVVLTEEQETGTTFNGRELA